MDLLKSIYRTHTCGELRSAHADQAVTLSGWIMRIRDHGGVIFIDLRDNYGVTQIIFNDSQRDQAKDFRVESVITVKGKVVKRGANLINSNIETGEVEVHVSEVTLQSEAAVLPFQIAEDDNAPENTRLKYRFLELRREKLHKNILLRSNVIRRVREIMHELGFTEFQSPILTSSSPEGARDFLVPSRFHPGRFFALPQAPQQFKQLLMVAGFDRYFQIAPCFRDEDPRADRSPGEFYQCDLEMSYVEQEDVFKTCEQLFYKLFSSFTKWDVTKPSFPRIRFEDAISDYGTDKPDLRIPLKIQNISHLFRETSFKVFRSVLDSNGQIYALKLDLKEIPPRKYFDDTVKFFQDLAGVGVAYLNFEGEALKGSIAKFISDPEAKELRAALKTGACSVVFLAAGERKILTALGKLRQKLGADFNLAEKEAYRFCWITDFPMYERNLDTGQIEFSHNPFSMPQGGLEALKTKDPLTIYAYQYDVVCNGHELSSGAIRNHSPELMYEAFRIAGYGKEDVDNKFGGMIRAFTYGAPPHGGMAPGIDRIVMLLANENAIREVIAFPMAQSVEDLMMGAPSSVSEKQLREAHIRVVLPEKG